MAASFSNTSDDTGAVKEVEIETAGGAEGLDAIAVEEPLEIRLGHRTERGWETHPISVTMRTPGEDGELAAGFLFTEGIVRERGEIARVEAARRNVVRVDLRADVVVDVERLKRHFYTTSSCGVCGKTSIEALETRGCGALEDDGMRVAAEAIHGMPETLRSGQAVFARTGGLHAAGLFDATGTLIALREDVGRHNAVDKLIGSRFLAGETPLTGRVLMVSGRVSFELVQKALMAGAPVLAAVGAPSSLAVELAREFDVTLLGFVRNRMFNIYSYSRRILVT